MRKILIRTFFIVLASGILCSSTYAQRPKLPELGFGVREEGTPYQLSSDLNFNQTETDWWPDSRIWTVPSRVVGEDTLWRDVIVPVTINNRWYNFNKVAGVKFQELSSFSFSVYYDNRVLQFVDVVKEHPFTEEEARNLGSTRFWNSSSDIYYAPLAHHFNVVASDESVNDYYRYFNTNVPNYSTVGKKVTLSGTAYSTYNLDTTAQYERKVLMYLRFRVLVKTSSGVGAQRLSKLYFDPTYIVFNGINIAKDQGLRLLEDFPTNPLDPNYSISRQQTFETPSTIFETNDNMPYFDPTWIDQIKENEVQLKSVGLQKYRNYHNDEKYAADPYLPGSIDLRVMTVYPEFRFQVINPPPQSVTPSNAQIIQDPEDHSSWMLADIIAADSLAFKRTSYQNRSEREIRITTNGDDYRTMENIIVETDQPWLRVRTNPVISGQFDDKFGTGTRNVRRAFVQRINNLIRADGSYNPFVSTSSATENMPSGFRFFIDCDQTGLLAGEYFGYVTLKSDFDRNEITRIKVRFIVQDHPIERANTLPAGVETPYGIKIKLTPSINSVIRTDLTKTLIFGSGPLATDFVDTLYGEYPRQEELGTARGGVAEVFDARFFLDTTVYTQEDKDNFTDEEKAFWYDLSRYGYGDGTHWDGVPNTVANDLKQPRSNSRDIRSSIPSEKSHLYYVKFKYQEPGTDIYPVVLEWDVNQFVPEQNLVHLKYMVNGVWYITDMRSEGTPIGDGKYTFAFYDHNVQEFWIEYTIGESQSSNLVDNWGEDMIVEKAWNFVSLPLDPVNKFYSYIFPNALNIPYLFSQNQWQQPVNGLLQRGVGYFVKYQTLVDKQFTGAPIQRITSADGVIVYGDEETGWNAIGSLSYIASIDDIRFSEYQGETSNVNYMLNRGVWGYRPTHGYQEVQQLFPGKAYWIRVDQNGIYNLELHGKSSFAGLPSGISNKVAGFDRISVADNEQNIANIYAANNIDAKNYELPPLPPAEMFDVRFAKGTYATDYSESLVNMQGVNYPVVVNFDRPRANYTVVDPISGFIYGIVKAGENTNVVINNSKSNSFKLVAEASNDAFFVTVNDNPVLSGTAEVAFGIDSDANVSISIFNSLGNEVSMLDAGYLVKGVYNRTLDVNTLPSGSYTIRLIAGTEYRIFKMNVVK